jgi:ferredoxin--NADP+ reductase
MARILSNRLLSAQVYRIEVEAPLIAAERKPGQFVMVQLDEFTERIPLTIADADPVAGTISLIFQAVGQSTKLLAACKAGDDIQHLLGPLGKATHIEKVGTVVCVGGGIGVAPLYPIAQGMKREGNRLVVIMGARNRELLILEEEMRAIADELVICTDDGSYGRKGLVTAPLVEYCRADPKPALAVAIGPPLMMKFCAEATRPFGVPTVVSLNTIMVDGTGMCGGCRVTVGGKTVFTCVDGPEFDGHLVDFDSFIKRQASYRQHERCATDDCNLTKAAVPPAAKPT